jgi:cyclic pyranopterin phosphate synthase
VDFRKLEISYRVSLPKKELMTLEELDRMCTTFVGLGVEKLRMTGGEPLVHRDLMTFLRV